MLVMTDQILGEKMSHRERKAAAFDVLDEQARLLQIQNGGRWLNFSDFVGFHFVRSCGQHWRYHLFTD